MKTDRPILLADIGGTNARFAMVPEPAAALQQTQTLQCMDFPTLSATVRAYLRSIGNPQPRHAVIAVATPVAGDQITMTNHSWRFSVAATRAELGLDSFKVINDFSALALSLPFLSDAECRQVGGGGPARAETMAVLGPGTGLGVSGSVACGPNRVILQGEGGHVSYGPLDPREAEVIAAIRQRYAHVSAERIVSGPGLALLYEVLTELDGARIDGCTPADVTRMAIEGTCAAAEEAVAIFCAVLGTVAGDLALTLGARGGVYIGGGVVPKLGEFFDRSAFRARFEQHGRFSDYLAAIPTYVIEAKQPALIGVRAALADDQAYLGVTSRASD